MNHATLIADALKIRATQATAVLDLLAAGNTIPFIARYRKEATGSLDEEQIRQINDMAARLQALDERRQTILATIAAQGKLTPELQQQIEAVATLTELEDLYQPYKPKRKTRASVARAQGLEPLAQLIWQQIRTRETAIDLAAPFLSTELPDAATALVGARDIVAEMLSDHAVIRQRVREKARQQGTLRARKIADAIDERQVYALYYEADFRVDRLKPHQILAINRGEAEKVLRVHLDVDEKDWLLAMRSVVRPDPRSPLAEQLQMAMADSAQRLLLPAIERDIRRALTEQAEAHAIAVFGENLRNLLIQPPLAGHTVLGIDPGYRTGCKVAIVDPTGKVLDTGTIYPHPPQNRWQEALMQLAAWVSRYQVTLIAIGNGTASRETEQLVAELTRTQDGVHYLMANEAGASVYSASKLAKEELPHLDVTLRGAVSIARRVQDPLAELVKIEPKAIGVGLYQHDVNQKQLAETLVGVVESVVNHVGVDVNTASPALLTYVSGIGPKLAEKIVAQREQHGRFPNRQSLLSVSGLGSKAFEQCAGFLRIRDGDNPLDASAIHPESYAVATAVLQLAQLSPTAPLPQRQAALTALQQKHPLPELAARLHVGLPTLTDIFAQLIRPGRDPRAELPPPLLRSDVLSMEDLRPGMRLNGTVRNVVDFGAFVDIGVKQDGLLHRSHIPHHVRLGVGDVIEVAVLSVEPERNRIGLGWPDG